MGRSIVRDTSWVGVVAGVRDRATCRLEEGVALRFGLGLQVG